MLQLAIAAISLGALVAAGAMASRSTFLSDRPYDAVVLADHPVAYWPLANSPVDLTYRGADGVIHGGTLATTRMPNGDPAKVFDGRGQYISITSRPTFSIPTTGALTWEAWIRPDILQFPHDSNGYVDFLGKCLQYSPTCEWEGRFYNQVNPQGRTSRISAYVFNPGAGLGSAADWQPTPGVITASMWIHIVAEYQIHTTPSDCSPAYPGTINIWVNGIKQNFSAHKPTGCMSQYRIIPKAGYSPFTIGTLAKDTWFRGAISKVAVYDRLLPESRIVQHYENMTGRAPAGQCAQTCTLTGTTRW
jgi:hypothetical protein